MRREENLSELSTSHQDCQEAPARGGRDGQAGAISVPDVSSVAHGRGKAVQKSDDWEAVHKARAWGQYPNEHVVRFVLTHYGPVAARQRVRFLDIGAGGGASTWFLAREGYGVRAVDVSASAIRRLRDRVTADHLSALVATQVGDIAHMEFPGVTFDAAIDAATLQHLSPEDVLTAVGKVWSVLRPGGRMLSLMASDAFDHREVYPIAPRVASRGQVDVMFGRFTSVRVGHEAQVRPDGVSISSWIVEAVK